MEHESQYVCSACLAGMQVPGEAVRAKTSASLLFGFAAALLGAWFFFYLVGEALIRIQG